VYPDPDPWTPNMRIQIWIQNPEQYVSLFLLISPCKIVKCNCTVYYNKKINIEKG
jgi:hypothetical protein